MKPFIGSKKNTHSFHREKYILTGYRTNYKTMKKTFKSLFEFHNETINIWTHLIGFGFLFMLIVFIALQPNVVTIKDNVILNINSKFEKIQENLKKFDASQTVDQFIDTLSENFHEFGPSSYILNNENIKQ